jgi:hypothetical protein
MPSVSTILKGLFVLAPLVAAVPANLADRQEMSKSASASATASSSATESKAASTSSAAGAAATGGLSDVDILQL